MPESGLEQEFEPSIRDIDETYPNRKRKTRDLSDERQPQLKNPDFDFSGQICQVPQELRNDLSLAQKGSRNGPNAGNVSRPSTGGGPPKKRRKPEPETTARE